MAYIQKRDLSPNPQSSEQRARILADPGFGAVFTDHMGDMRYENGAWQPGSIRPYAPIEISPAAMVLHYGQAIFEGLKAYSHAGGGICCFRPRENAKRLNRSAARLAIPSVPEDAFIEVVDELLKVDEHWMPSIPDSSIYLRPVVFATEEALGVRAAKEYQFLLLASPSGPYFPTGMRPIKVWLSLDFARAVEHGTGAVKFAGNYSGTLKPQMDAAEKGCSQVLYADAKQQRFVEEMGGMNVFFVIQEGGRKTLTTPALERGTILPGITRNSLIQLAKDAGYPVECRDIEIDELERRSKDGSLLEAFACGTAAVITPIAQLCSARGDWTFNQGETGPIAQELYTTLVGIQRGSVKDAHGWVHHVTSS